MIDYTCPKCGAAMSSPDSQAEQSETCPACGNVAVVPKGKTGWLYQKKPHVIVAVAVTLTALFVWWSLGAYRDWADSPSPKTEHSTSEDGSTIAIEYTNVGHKILRKWETMPDGTKIITRYDKDTGKPIHMTMAFPGKDGETAWPGLDAYCEGPITESGKQHGKWVASIGLKKMAERPNAITRTEQWYWYGEKVSEGEFHLRDRR